MSRLLGPRSGDVSAEREALQELIGTDGWRAFCAHALREWQGVGYVARMGTALAKDDAIAPRVVHRTAEEVQRLLQWPTDRVLELKGVVDE